MIKQKALVLTNGMLDSTFAKTCHGLIRGTDRFAVLAIIDHKFAGKDAGEVLDGKTRQIPVVSSVSDYLADQNNAKPEVCIVGVATPGGQLPSDFRSELKLAAQHSCDLINGLHTFLSDDPEFEQLAKDFSIQLIDIRKPRPRHELQFWTGEIFQVEQPIIAVLGTDCALGKRTTSRWIMESLRAREKTAEMIYTGQTGWMQGSPYGFIFDSTVNDFIGGELEKAVVACARAANPDYILLEGQSALRNPSGPCGSEYILSANAKGVILQHAPGRHCFEGSEIPIGSIQQDLTLTEAYGAQVLAITLNGEELSETELIIEQEKLRQQTGLPVVRPLQEGVEEVVDAILRWR